MKRSIWRRAILLFFGLAALTAVCCGGFYAIVAPAERIANSENPPATFQASNLVGTWETVYGHRGDYSYGEGNDRLILRADGTFKQIYENQSEDYVYETPWNEWSVERFSDGRVRVHLKGARYYLAGIRQAEQEGALPPALQVTEGEPRSYYDPFAEESVHMVGELVLNVRVFHSGELALAHMWASSEWGFGDADLFHYAEMSSPLQTLAP